MSLPSRSQAIACALTGLVLASVASLTERAAADDRSVTSDGTKASDTIKSIEATCKPGYVWRSAGPNDRICVTPEARAVAKRENAEASSHVDAKGAYGPNTCLPGFVWRNAFEGDLACVTPEARDRARRENVGGEYTRVGTADMIILKAPGMAPEASRPGQHTIALDVAESNARAIEKTFGDVPVVGTFIGKGVLCVGAGDSRSPVVLAEFPGPLSGNVGWGQVEWGDGSCMAFVLQRAVRFNQTSLDEIPEKTIDRAVLVYDETKGLFCPLVVGGSFECWQSGDGAPEPKPDGCAVVRVPSVAWPNNTPGLLPYLVNGTFVPPSVFDPSVAPSMSVGARGPVVNRISAREWDVTEPFLWQYQPASAPIGEAPQGFGFLLSSGPLFESLTARDNTVCVSTISNIKLMVTYTVPPPSEPFRDPK